MWESANSNGKWLTGVRVRRDCQKFTMQPSGIPWQPFLMAPDELNTTLDKEIEQFGRPHVALELHGSKIVSLVATGCVWAWAAYVIS